MTSLGLFIARLALSAVFAAHGAHKLFGVFGGPGTGLGPGGLTATAAHFSRIGVEPAFLMAVLGGLLQLVGGLLLGVGFLSRWAAAALVGYLAIGAWKEHATWGFFLNWTANATLGHGLEYSIVLAASLACIVFAGAGDMSIDGLRSRTAASRAAGKARLRGR
jgi:putative oxidoreductase